MSDCLHYFTTAHLDGLTCTKCGEKLCDWCAEVGGHKEGCDVARGAVLEDIRAQRELDELWLDELEYRYDGLVDRGTVWNRLKVTWFLISRRPVRIVILGRQLRFPRVWIIRKVLLVRRWNHG